MTRWQHRLRFGLLVFALLFAAGVYFSLRERIPAAAPAKVERTDPKAVAEMTNAVAHQSKGLRRDLDITFDRALSYEDGSTKFLGARMVVPQRSGRTFTISAKEAMQKGEVNSAEKPLDVQMKGQVRLKTSDGFEAHTEEATYSEPESILRAPKAVGFTRERMSGSGTGANYDKQRDVLWLLADATIDVKADAKGSGALNMSAGSAGLARADRYLRLQNGAHIRRDNRNIDSAEAMVYFHQTEDRMELMELRGGVRIAGGTHAAGGLQDMTADAVNLHFTDDGQTLQRSTLAGKSSIQLAGAAGQAGRRITADWLELMFAPDGSIVTQISARDQVTLEFPAEGESPSRVVRAVRLEGTGDPGQGLTGARLAGNVEFREQRAATKTGPATDRQVTAQSLEMALAAGMAGINEATFTGDVKLRDGDLSADAPEMKYQLAAQTLNLIAPADKPNALTLVTDRDTTIEARRISVALDGRKMQAEEGVRTQLRPSKSQPQGKTPGMLKDDIPVLATAKQLTYDGGAGSAQYTGDAKLWQGDQTAVYADVIVLDREKGNLTGKGSARSVMIFDDKTDPAKPPEQVNALARAGELSYDEEARRLTYVGDAHVTGPQGDLTAKRVEMFLGKTQGALERIEAYEDVKVKLTGRVATGARLTYFGADARYEISGEPASLVETLERECRETTSPTLTFSRSTATISAGSNEKTRTQTKSGVTCPEPGVK